jgi:zinc D-Ala-D-Ala carboxypeptidase
MMYLSANFTVDEFVASQTAAREGIDNDLPIELLPAAKRTAYGLEMVRTLLGDKPILISSGYRSAALNAAVKGSQGSQHLVAEAVDFTCPSFGTPAQIVNTLVKSQLYYDQCILEFGRWVHISFNDRNRKQALIIDKDGTRAYG